MIAQLEGQLEHQGKEEDKLKITVEYRELIEAELDGICDRVISMLENTLVPFAKDDEGRVFYNKMKGDYCRYKAEYKNNDEKDEVAKRADEAYAQAYQNSKSLQSTHPIRLGLALNYSVFHYETLKKTQEACDMARDAFENAINELDSVTEVRFRCFR